MSEALERVIAEQQKEIDRLRLMEKHNIEAWQRENASLQAEIGQLRELSDEMFSAMTAALLLAPHSSGAYSVLDDAVKSLQPKWIRHMERQS